MNTSFSKIEPEWYVFEHHWVKWPQQYTAIGNVRSEPHWRGRERGCGLETTSL